ncbi:hypothetical protein NDU88_003308 [Pleurodeles waltl]|uniref:Uncharacterized protein n=1 Tax=Pleurodeles waltl TaxID=8319 RepID=A0AAV7P9J6_PLEWA|nr:hypothetical protein NDU88_003308 [Pleurodeles waltl]
MGDKRLPGSKHPQTFAGDQAAGEKTGRRNDPPHPSGASSPERDHVCSDHSSARRNDLEPRFCSLRPPRQISTLTASAAWKKERSGAPHWQPSPAASDTSTPRREKREKEALTCHATEHGPSSQTRYPASDTRRGRSLRRRGPSQENPRQWGPLAGKSRTAALRKGELPHRSRGESFLR